MTPLRTNCSELFLLTWGTKLLGPRNPKVHVAKSASDEPWRDKFSIFEPPPTYEIDDEDESPVPHVLALA
eukprot:3861433-Prymnesium_polylepis.1